MPAACSVEKNTGATRFYHSLTARYNIYFNGYESFKAGVLKVEKGTQDDYAELLRVFKYSDPQSPSLCSSEMEVAIQKASKLISLKSITSRPEVKDPEKEAELANDLLKRKEYNEWVDDSYLLIGMARFYKQEYTEGATIFSYCINEANDLLIKKEAAIWLARIYNETKNYSEAYRLLMEMEIGSEQPKRLQEMYYATLADLFIKQKRYQEAIEPLTLATELARGKTNNYRYTYLLAQLNELAGNHAEAARLFRNVVKMKPPYDVEFNARINIAGVFDVTSGDPKSLRKELEKMLRDSKNKEFHDQIYYALGNISISEGNETEALSFFRKSAASPSLNVNQKGRTYMALADYYYRIPDYMKAGKYYDSTVIFLPEKHPNYPALKEKSLNLNTLTEQLEIIAREDSLQKVARMPSSERDVLIAAIINQVTQDEARGVTSQYADRYNLGQYYENERRFQGNIEQEGKWYFYNQAALTFGRSEFRRRYGERRLEDNWRRSNKARVAANQFGEAPEEEATQKNDSVANPNDNKRPAYYLSFLPLTDSLMALSNARIAFASLNAGKAYAEKVSEPEKATGILENLLSRFPEDELVPEALFTLYNINKGGARGESYRQRLIEKYPETEFAKILTDPAYYEKKLALLKRAENLYTDAYASYSLENFEKAIASCNEALAEFGQSTLAPKFMLLRAYSVARIQNERAFKAELAQIIKAYPASEEGKRAAEISEFLNQEIPELKVEEEITIARELFVADTTQSHLFAVIINNPSFNLNQAVFDVISYNIDNYTSDNYRTEGKLSDNKYIIITVTGFKNYKTALSYYNSFNTASVIRNPSNAQIFSFVISTANLEALSRDLNPQRYLIFFRENYLRTE